MGGAHASAEYWDSTALVHTDVQAEPEYAVENVFGLNDVKVRSQRLVHEENDDVNTEL